MDHLINAAGVKIIIPYQRNVDFVADTFRAFIFSDQAHSPPSGYVNKHLA